MQWNILWAGIARTSLENCTLTSFESGWEASSVIVGADGEKIFRLEYFIRTNSNWETVLLQLTTTVDGHTESLVLQGDGQGNWMQNQADAPEFEGCIDVDISLTPFTNTLPINRLRLQNGETRQIRVLYFDILYGEVKPVSQQYTRLSETEYKYENVPNDFEAVIRVDKEGLLEDYPGLFTRTGIKESQVIP